MDESSGDKTIESPESFSMEEQRQASPYSGESAQTPWHPDAGRTVSEREDGFVKGKHFEISDSHGYDRLWVFREAGGHRGDKWFVEGPFGGGELRQTPFSPNVERLLKGVRRVGREGDIDHIGLARLPALQLYLEGALSKDRLLQAVEDKSSVRVQVPFEGTDREVKITKYGENGQYAGIYDADGNTLASLDKQGNVVVTLRDT